jgi:hypothetical protein
MSKMSEKLYELCLQVAVSRHYEVDANEVQDSFLSSEGLTFGFAPDWVIHQHKSEDTKFWFAFAPDYSGILHADNLVDLSDMLLQLVSLCPAGWDSVEA